MWQAEGKQQQQGKLKQVAFLPIQSSLINPCSPFFFQILCISILSLIPVIIAMLNIDTML
jgi:hypothetical protein